MKILTYRYAGAEDLRLITPCPNGEEIGGDGIQVGSLSCADCRHFIAKNELNHTVVCGNSKVTVSAVLTGIRISPEEEGCKCCAFFAGPVECPGGKTCTTRYIVKSYITND